MAKSGIKDIKVTDWDTLRFIWWEHERRTTQNETLVGWELQLISTTYGAIYSNPLREWNVTVNGTAYSGSVSVAINNNETRVLASGKTTVPHNADGTKTFSYSFSQVFNITFSEVWIGTKSGSGTGTLDAIPRAAILNTAPDINDETNSVTITFNNPSGSNIEELAICIGDRNWKAITHYSIIENINATSYTYEISENDKILLRRAATKNTFEIRYYLRSKIDGVYYFTTLDKTLTIVNPNPILNPSIINTHPSASVINDATKILKGLNTLEYSIGASAVKEATIVSQTLTFNGITYTNPTGTLKDVESGSFVFSIKDSRGNVVSDTINLTIIDYIKVTCKQQIGISLQGETEAKVDIEAKGNFFNTMIGTTRNALTLYLRHTNEDGVMGDWINLNSVFVEPTYDGNTYQANFSISGLNYEKAYTFQMKAIDKVSEEITEEYVIRLTPVFDWGESDFNLNYPLSLKGNTVLRATDENRVILSASQGDIFIRPNGSTTDAGQLRVMTDGRLNIDGSIMNDFVIEQNTLSNGWTYTKWVSGRVELCGSFTINTGITEQKGSLYRTNALTIVLPFKVYGGIYWIDCTDGNVWASTARNTYDIENVRYILYAPWSIDIGTFYVDCKIEGRWKQ